MKSRHHRAFRCTVRASASCSGVAPTALAQTIWICLI